MRSIRSFVPAGRVAAVAASKALGGSPCASAWVTPSTARDKTAAPSRFAFVPFVMRMHLVENLTAKLRKLAGPLLRLTVHLWRRRLGKERFNAPYEDSYDRDLRRCAPYYK